MAGGECRLPGSLPRRVLCIGVRPGGYKFGGDPRGAVGGRGVHAELQSRSRGVAGRNAPTTSQGNRMLRLQGVQPHQIFGISGKPTAPQPRRPKLESMDITALGNGQLTELLDKAQAELATRARQNRKDLRTELERRVAAEGYKMNDIFPELGTTSSGGTRRRRPAKYRDPQNAERTWSGIGRTPKWVQAILDERGVDMATFKSIPMYRIHAEG